MPRCARPRASVRPPRSYWQSRHGHPLQCPGGRRLDRRARHGRGDRSEPGCAPTSNWLLWRRSSSSGTRRFRWRSPHAPSAPPPGAPSAPTPSSWPRGYGPGHFPARRAGWRPCAAHVGRRGGAAGGPAGGSARGGGRRRCARRRDRRHRADHGRGRHPRRPRTHTDGRPTRIQCRAVARRPAHRARGTTAARRGRGRADDDSPTRSPRCAVGRWRRAPRRCGRGGDRRRSGDRVAGRQWPGARQRGGVRLHQPRRGRRIRRRRRGSLAPRHTEMSVVEGEENGRRFVALYRRAAGSPESLPGTCPSKPACTARLSSARPNRTH